MDSQNLFPSPTLRPQLAVRDWLLALIFFAGGLWLFTQDNHFPSFYHPDEPSKAKQVIDHDYNFNHPMLLLQTTSVITAITHTPMTPQPVTEAGRLASALFTAGAVACMVLLGCHLRGWTAGILAGAFLLVNQHLYELSHYMKEDPALTFGIAVFFLAFVRCWLRPSLVRFAWLGVGCALAISGKYLGVVVLPLAVWAIIAAPKGERWKLGAVTLAGFLAIFVLVNFPMLASLKIFAGNVEREMNMAVSGHKGLTRSVPHGVYGAVFREETNPAIWIALAIYYFALLFNFIMKLARWVLTWLEKISQRIVVPGWLKNIKAARWIAVWLEKIFRQILVSVENAARRQTSLVEWALALFPVAYVLMLSFSPKTHNRYFLPDTVLFCTLSAVGIASVRIPRIAQLSAGLVVVIVSFFYLKPCVDAFQKDSRAALVSYVRANVPANATIVQDKRVNLPNRNVPRQADSPYFLDQPLLGKLFAADEGTIEELRARNIHYIAVSEGDYGRYFLATHKPKDDDRADYDRRKKFYETLFAEGKLLWECKSGDNLYLQPSIKLYYLP